MKNLSIKSIVLFAFLCYNAMQCFAQPEWETIRTGFNMNCSEKLEITDEQDNSITLWNFNARTEDEIAKNVIRYGTGTIEVDENVSSSLKRISFSITNIHNNPANNHYYVYNENKKREVARALAWSFIVRYTKNETPYYIRFSYKTSVNNIGQNIYSYSQAYNTVRSGKGNQGWSQTYYSLPTRIRIEYSNDMIRIYDAFPDGKIQEINGVDCIDKIQIGLSSGTKLKFYNFKIEEATLYGCVKDFITQGDKLVQSEKYYQATIEYSKAIDKGYKNYDIYMKRAKACIGAEYYHNALKDLTTALSYKETIEAYLMRGKLKFQMQDASCVEDLQRGGSEGEMILTEIAGMVNNMPKLGDSYDTSQYTASGSGMVLTTNGIIITNYHVVENAQKVDVFIKRTNGVKKYNTKVLVSDKQNDLTLLKIDDATFTDLPALPYAVKTPILDVGTSVFALGYPMSSTLGEELKVTDGIISSKTGYQGDIVTYQISAPIQPGNSGGPLFDKQGYLVGITNAGVPDAQNVGYAIKASYLRNLVDVSPVPFALPSNNTISGLSFTEKIKKISPYVVLIKVK